MTIDRNQPCNRKTNAVSPKFPPETEPLRFNRARPGLSALAFCLFLLLLAGCGGGGSSEGLSSNSPNDGASPAPSSSGDNTSILAGVIIDGPVSAAQVEIRDRDGNLVASAETDANARFQAQIPTTASYPLSVSSTGGTNLTTGSAPEFTLQGLVLDADQGPVIVSAVSTLLHQRASCHADDGDAGNQFREQTLDFLPANSLGLPADSTGYTLSQQPGDAQAAAQLLLASETLAEALRRSADAYAQTGQPITQEQILAAVACPEPGDQPAAGIAGTFHLATTATLLEASTGDLRIAQRDTNAIPMLMNASAQVFDMPDTLEEGAFAIDPSVREQLLTGVLAALEMTPDSSLFDLYSQLLTMGSSSSGQWTDSLTASSSSRPALQNLLEHAATEHEMASQFTSVLQTDSSGVPPADIAINATPAMLASVGDSASIEFEATGAAYCRLQENGVAGWEGLTGSTGTIAVGPLHQDKEFTLSCLGDGGLMEASVTVQTPAAVAIHFTDGSGQNPEFFELGDSVHIGYEKLNLSAEQCQFQDPETGAALESGTAITAQPETSVTVTCESEYGTVMTSRSVPVRAAKLSWLAPTETESGDRLTNLAGFHVFHGEQSGDYGDDVITIRDPDQDTLVQAFDAGERYFAIRAFTKDGQTSRLSNEVSKAIP